MSTSINFNVVITPLSPIVFGANVPATPTAERKLQIANLKRKLKATELQRTRDDMVARAYVHLIDITEKIPENRSEVEVDFLRSMKFLENKYGVGVQAAGREAGFLLRDALVALDCDVSLVEPTSPVGAKRTKPDTNSDTKPDTNSDTRRVERRLTDGR